MKSGTLGKTYQHKEIIIHQGDPGDSVYIIQKGLVEIIKEIDGKEVQLAVLSKGGLFGGMAVFEHEHRMAYVRALGEARVLTIDKRNFLRRVYEDPSLAFHLVQVMSARIRELSNEILDLRI